MNYIFDLEDRLSMALAILTSMAFDVNLIESITYNATGNVVTFYYKGDTVWQVDLEDKKQRCMNNGAWTDWVYIYKGECCNMITLKVEDYCHSCPDFKPNAATIGITHGFSDKMFYETVVYCKNHETCKKLYEHIKKETNK